MPLRPLLYREVRRRLLAARFNETTRKDSHVKFVKVGRKGTQSAIVPDHRESTIETLRQAGLTSQDFEEL